MKKVLVIGAGWSGIYAAKHLLEAGFEPKIFEKSHSFMGQWHIHNGPGGVIRNTHATSSIGYMQPSDFPFPKGIPDFPHHSLVFQHIGNYIKHFKLESYIHYNHTVTKLEKVKGKWLAVVNNTFSETYDYVVVATGLNKVPSFPDKKLFSKFKGEKIHSHFFKELPERWKGKTILIVGGGETAADIANEICDSCKVIMSIKEGVWFQDKILGAYEPADMFFNRMVHFFFRWWANLFFRKQVEFWWGSGGTGVWFWRPTSPYLNGIYNKSRNVIHRISEGRVVPMPGIKNVAKNGVKFRGEKKFTDVDAIIFGTGYNLEHSFDFLPEKLRHHNRYKHIFIPEDNTIAFIGFVRPFLGSIPMLAELQSRFVAEIFRNRVKLPSIHYMQNIILKDQKRHIKDFPADGKRVSFLVDPYYYCTEIGHYIGASPKMLKLFFTHFNLWRKLFLQPWSPFHWRIYDKDSRKRKLAIQQINKLENHPAAIRLRWKIKVTFFIWFLPLVTFLLGIFFGRFFLFF